MAKIKICVCKLCGKNLLWGNIPKITNMKRCPSRSVMLLGVADTSPHMSHTRLTYVTTRLTCHDTPHIVHSLDAACSFFISLS